MSYEMVEQIVEVIRSLSQQTIFSCQFTKRTTGETRLMVCRLGVNKHITGKGARFDPAAHKLIRVFDMQADGWRSIPLDGIDWIKIRGKRYVFSSEGTLIEEGDHIEVEVPADA